MKRYIRNIAGIGVGAAVTLSFNSCRDDDSWNPYDTGEDGIVSLSLSVPDPMKIATRSGEDVLKERKINGFTVLLYDESGNLKQRSVYGNGNGESSDFSPNVEDTDYTTTFKLALNSDAKAENEKGKLKIVVVANANSLLDDDNCALLTELDKQYDTAEIATRTGGFVMSGQVSDVKLTKPSTTTIALSRTAVKFTGVVDPNDKTKDFQLTGIQLRNTATAGYLTGGMTSVIYQNVGEVSEMEEEVVYTYPTKKDNAFIIVKGTYKGDTENYYKVAIQKKKAGTTTNEKESIDILANHWYELHIEDVSGPGYASADLAAASESSNIEGYLEDQVAAVFTIASDGTHEVGVTDKVEYNGGVLANNEWSDKTFTLHLATLLGNEIASQMTEKSSSNDQIVYTLKDGSEVVISITEGSEWLDIKEATKNVSEKEVLNTYKLGFRSTLLSGVKTGTITVTWKGLERKVQIIWAQKFDASQICDVKLIIHNEDNSSTYTIQDYWTFLAGEGTRSNQASNGTAVGNTPRLWGVGMDENCGRIRNQGFHFPVEYGNTKWWYEYEITFKSSFSSSDPEVSLSNDFSGFECVKEGGVFKLRPKAGNRNPLGYTYKTGELSVTANGQPYPFHLYHTGFFHYQSKSSHRVENGSADDNAGYYYYEVLSMAERHWLDRNLGAKACGLSILDGNGTSIFPSDAVYPVNLAAQGAYYLPASYSGNWTYASTHLYTADLCPPGYRFPSTTEYDLMRNSNNFKTGLTTENSVSFYNSYYLADDKIDDVAIRVYFPKVKFYNGSDLAGDANSGYYWTSSDSYGLEKEEIGRWLQVLVLNGASNNYVNGNVETFGINIRCVANETDTKPNKVTSFNITGATHVYLYTKTNKSGIFPWPGKAVGDANTMLTKTFNFVYTSAYNPEDLMVLFNYVTNDGRIYTFSANNYGTNGANDDSKHFNISLNEVDGWPVVGSTNATVNKDFSQTTVTNAPNSSASGVGSTWTCTSGFQPVSYMSFGVVWPVGKGDKINILDVASGKWLLKSDGSFVNNGGKGWYNDGGYNNNGAYFYDGEVLSDYNGKKVKVVVSNGTTSWATGEIELNSSTWNRKFLYDSNFSLYTGEEVTPVTYRILWPQDGSYNQIKIKDASGNTLVDFTNNQGTQAYDGFLHYKYDYTTSATGSLKFEFKNTSTNKTTTPDPDNAYSLTSATEISNVKTIVVAKLKEEGGNEGEERTIRILWPQGDQYKYIRITDGSGTQLLGWTERKWGSYGLDGTNYNGYEWTTTATTYKFEFASSDSGANIAYPNPNKTYTTSDIHALSNHGANGIVINALSVTDPRDALNSSKEVSDGYRRVFWDNSTKNWTGDKKVYWWGGSKGLSSWDDRKTMTQVPNSDKYWYYDIPNDCTGFKFESGGSESSNKEGSNMWISTNKADKANTYSD